MKVDNIILGAGISGCSAGQIFHEDKSNYLILEKNPSIGGLTRSIYLGEAVFDYTGHFLHLTHWDNPAQIPFAGLKLDNWKRVIRNSGIYMDGSLIPAPFQYNLKFLPENLRQQCLDKYIARTKATFSNNLKDYFINEFGEGIAESFLIPYNQKMLDIDLSDISLQNIKRFFPKAEDKLVLEGKNDNVSPEYNSKFWYPVSDGIGVLADGLAQNLKILKNVRITRIKLKEKKITTNFGEISYSNLISSIPLKYFCERTDNPQLIKLGRALSCNKVLSLNVLNKGRLKARFNDFHWLYFPEEKFPFFRIGFYSNISGSLYNDSVTALYIEQSFSQKNNISNLNSIVNKLVRALKNLDIFEEFNITHMTANIIDPAYVHFTHNYELIVKNILNYTEPNNVHFIGRYGMWDYISMEDSIRSGMNTANRIRM